MKKYKAQTASEFLKQLEKDPEYQERTRKREEELRQFQIKRAIEEKPFFDELIKNRFEVDKVSETESCLNFVIDTKEKIKAVPILLKHIAMDYSYPIKRDLYNTLNTPLVRGIVGQELITRFVVETPELRDEIAHILCAVATDNDLEGLLELIQNKDFGDDRGELVWSVARLMRRQAQPIFLNILEQEKNLNDRNNLSLNLITALSDMKVLEGKKYAEYYTKHKIAEYRNQAKKALRKINNINQITPKLPQNIELIKDNVMTGKYEASSSLDLDVAVKFVRSLSPILNIKPKDLENLVLDIDVQQTKSYKISLKSLLNSTILCMQAFMEDNSTTTIYFLSNSKSMINKINKKLSKFLDSRENGLNR